MKMIVPTIKGTINQSIEEKIKGCRKSTAPTKIGKRYTMITENKANRIDNKRTEIVIESFNCASLAKYKPPFIVKFEVNQINDKRFM